VGGLDCRRAVGGVLAVLVVAGVLLGCAPAARTPAGTPADEVLGPPLRIRGSFAADLQGRPFMFLVLEGQEMPGEVDHYLQIEGDGVIVSFHSSTPPFVPSVRGDAVSFGGHVFGATATPNAFTVDGQPHQLPSGGLYIFSDGQYGGRYQRR
jgi:hypothetical protein